MIQKCSCVLLICAAVMAIGSCRKDFEYAPSAGNLEFSMDTVYLDTVFKSISSSTYNLKVYNPTRDDVLIPSIRLRNGDGSAYRLNVDGLPGTSFENIALQAQDSLFIGIEVTLSALPDTLNTFLYTDAIAFDTGSFLQEIPMVTLVKDAKFLFPPTTGSGEKSTVNVTFYMDDEATKTPGFELRDDQLNFTNKKPYVIYGMAVVPQGKTLTIAAGARVHFHKDAGLLVRSGAQLIIDGELSGDQNVLENEVVFEGDRLEPQFSDIPGQWYGILFEKGALPHSISHLTVKNARVGIFVEGTEGADMPQFNLRNTQIYNSEEYNLWTKNVALVAENVVLGGAGNSSLYCSQGGAYSFTHCTIANYWNRGFRRGPALRLANTATTSGGRVLEGNLEMARFRNCIIDGNGMQELVLEPNGINTFHFTLENCLLKYRQNGAPNHENGLYDFNDPSLFMAVVLNGEASFLDPGENDFRISEESEAAGKGNLEWGLEIPTDLLGNDRTSTVDLGAYQSTPLEKMN